MAKDWKKFSKRVFVVVLVNFSIKDYLFVRLNSGHAHEIREEHLSIINMDAKPQLFCSSEYSF